MGHTPGPFQGFNSAYFTNFVDNGCRGITKVGRIYKIMKTDINHLRYLTAALEREGKIASAIIVTYAIKEIQAARLGKPVPEETPLPIKWVACSYEEALDAITRGKKAQVRCKFDGSQAPWVNLLKPLEDRFSGWVFRMEEFAGEPVSLPPAARANDELAEMLRTTTEDRDRYLNMLVQVQGLINGITKLDRGVQSASTAFNEPPGARLEARGMQEDPIDWHNPEGLKLTEQERKEGWRFLVKGEEPDYGKDECVRYSARPVSPNNPWVALDVEYGDHFLNQWTYRTKRPLPTTSDSQHITTP